jgi:hypothetical protein
MSVNCSLAARYGLGTNEHVEKFKREYAEKLNREEYAKELKQMRSVSSFTFIITFYCFEFVSVSVLG